MGGDLDPIRLGSTVPRIYAGMVEEEKEFASAADHMAVYHRRELLTRGHIRDRLLWIEEYAAERRRSLARPVEIPSDFALERACPQADGFLHRD